MKKAATNVHDCEIRFGRFTDSGECVPITIAASGEVRLTPRIADDVQCFRGEKFMIDETPLGATKIMDITVNGKSQFPSQSVGVPSFVFCHSLGSGTRWDTWERGKELPTITVKNTSQAPVKWLARLFGKAVVEDAA